MSREKAMTAHMPAEFRGLVEACQEANTPLANAFMDRYAEVIRDQGDGDRISVTKRSEARDYAALDILIESMLADALAGKPIDLGGLTQIMNSKLGKGRVLGFSHTPKRINTLAQVMKGAP